MGVQIQERRVPAVIGVDHGFGMLKTARTSMFSGITAFETEPPTKEHVLRLDGKYYVCGANRMILSPNKTVNKDYALLTLAAIAEEIKAIDKESRENNKPCRFGSRVVDVIIAAGLPLTQFGRDKAEFREYLLHSFSQPVTFLYEDQPYTINIQDVAIYPQGYAVAVTRMREVDLDFEEEPSIFAVDIGSWTVDAMRIDSGRPNMGVCASLEMGVIRCVSDIEEQMRRSMNRVYLPTKIEHLLRSPAKVNLEREGDRIVQAGLETYASQITGKLMESGLDLRAAPVVFMGGGALLMKHHLKDEIIQDNAHYIEDIHANAKGFQAIHRMVMKNART